MKETRETLDALLAQIEQQMNHQDDDPGAESQHEQQPQAYRLIDIHIYHSSQEPAEEEAVTVEGTIGEAEQEESTQPRAAQQQGVPAPAFQTKARSRRPLALALVMISLLLFEGGVGLYALPVMAPEATIIITPASRQIETSVTLTIEEGASNPGAGRIRGRAIDLTMSQEQTIKTTGTAHQIAVAAQGTITFYNAAPYSQSIPAGTFIIGAGEVQIVTDVEAIIPPAVYPTFGESSVTAHAATKGAAGNTEAGAIYGPCCRLNISAVSGTFTRGADARTYPTATKEEITKASEQMKRQLEQSIGATLKTQLASDETMLAPSCTQTKNASHQPGEEAAEIHVILEASCTVTAYSKSHYQSVITQLLNQQAHKELGEGYRLTGRPESEMVKATPRGDAREMVAKLIGVYSYHFTEAEQEQIKRLVSARSKAEAIAAVMNTKGVQAVAISLTNHALVLPADSKRISLVFLAN